MDFHDTMTRTAQIFHDRGMPGHGLNPLLLHEINRATGLHPVAVISGRVLVEETSKPMAGVPVSAISEDTESQYSTMTDARGLFMITEVPDGVYTLHVDGYDVSVDTLAMVFEQRDDLGVVVHARALPPEEVLPPESPANTSPSLASDGQGRVMLTWDHGGEIRNALFSNNTWQPNWVSMGSGSNPSLAWVPTILNDENPGWIVVWEVTGEDGVRHLQWALAGVDGTSIQITEPQALTNDGASDFFPAIAMEQDGALVLWIQGVPGVDDFDLYYSSVDPAKAGSWREEKSFIPAGLQLADTDCFEFTVGMGTGIPFVMQPIFGKSYQFNLVGAKCNEIPSCSGAGQSISGAMNVALGDTLTVGGGVEGSVSYGLQKKPCRYIFRKQALSVNGTIKGELDKPIPVFVAVVPVGTFYPNVAISGQATGSLIWLGRSGGLPTTGQVSFRPAGGGGGAFFAAGTKETNGLVAGSANVDISGLFTYSPTDGLDFGGMCVRLVGEAQVFYGYARRKVTSTWGSGCGKTLPEPGFLREVTDTMIRTSNVAIAEGNILHETVIEDVLESFQGTTAVHEGNAVLADVAAELFHDGRPSVAVSNSGEAIVAWRKDSGDYTQEIGSRIHVATRMETGWSAPEVLTPVAAFNQDPAIAFDILGNPIVFWSSSSSEGLAGTATISDLEEAAAKSELYYSVRRDGEWSAPAPFTSLGGANEQVAMATAPSGTVATWININDGRARVYTARWHNGAWSVPVRIGRTNLGQQPAIARNTSGFLLVWVEDGDDDAATPNDLVLRHALSNNGLDWATSQLLPAPLFAPPSNVTDLGAFTPKTAGKAAKGMPRVPDGCCGPKCPPRCPDKPKPPEKEPPHDPHPGPSIDVVRPSDPNEKVGMKGWGSSQVIDADSTIVYTVYFENVPTATAPAQEVFITDILDPQLDLATIEILEVAWGNEQIPLGGKGAAINERVTVNDHRADVDKAWWVDIQSTLDIPSRRLLFTFQTLDPDNGELPEDALAGFLPPNDDTRVGEGHVTFSVRLKPDTPNDLSYTLANEATIVFDTEAAITTNRYTNRIGDPDEARDGIVRVIIGVTHHEENVERYDMNEDKIIDAADLDD